MYFIVSQHYEEWFICSMIVKMIVENFCSFRYFSMLLDLTNKVEELKSKWHIVTALHCQRQLGLLSLQAMLGEFGCQRSLLVGEGHSKL